MKNKEIPNKLRWIRKACVIAVSLFLALSMIPQIEVFAKKPPTLGEPQQAEEIETSASKDDGDDDDETFALDLGPCDGYLSHPSNLSLADAAFLCFRQAPMVPQKNWSGSFISLQHAPCACGCGGYRSRQGVPDCLRRDSDPSLFRHVVCKALQGP